MQNPQIILSAGVAFLIGYLFGAFPTAYLVGRLNGVNIFELGSGNMGATNVTRALGAHWGLLVFVIDGLKGIGAVLAARLIMPELPDAASVISAVAAVIGHNWSLVVKLITGKLRGGKGAATAGGTWVVIFAPWAHLVLVPLSVCIVVVVATRYMSLAVLVTAAVGASLVLISRGTFQIPQDYLLYALVITALIYYRHRENIQRLLQGRERRLGERA
jgi:glycerol-3-phosphate acyltransferase PlsY